MEAILKNLDGRKCLPGSLAPQALHCGVNSRVRGRHRVCHGCSRTREYEAATLVRVQERGPNAGNASAALQASQDTGSDVRKDHWRGSAQGRNRDVRSPVPPPAHGDNAEPTRGLRPHRAIPKRPRTRQARPRARASHSVSPATAGFHRGASRRYPCQRVRFRISIFSRSQPEARIRRTHGSLRMQFHWALRAFIRDTGSATTEKIVTVKAATTPSSPVSRQSRTEHRARNHARPHLQRSPGPSARVLPRSASRSQTNSNGRSAVRCSRRFRACGSTRYPALRPQARSQDRSWRTSNHPLMAREFGRMRWVRAGTVRRKG